jgi:hypothetical protein
MLAARGPAVGRRREVGFAGYGDEMESAGYGDEMESAGYGDEASIT